MWIDTINYCLAIHFENYIWKMKVFNLVESIPKTKSLTFLHKKGALFQYVIAKRNWPRYHSLNGLNTSSKTTSSSSSHKTCINIYRTCGWLSPHNGFFFLSRCVAKIFTWVHPRPRISISVSTSKNSVSWFFLFPYGIKFRLYHILYIIIMGGKDFPPKI